MAIKNLAYNIKGEFKEKTPEEVVGEMFVLIDKLEKETEKLEFVCNKQVSSEHDYKLSHAKKYLENKMQGDNTIEVKAGRKREKTINDVENKTLVDLSDKRLQSELDKVLVDVQKQRIKNVDKKIEVYRSFLSFMKSDKEYTNNNYQP